MEKIIAALRDLGCHGPGFTFDHGERVLIATNTRQGISASKIAEKIIRYRRSAKPDQGIAGR